MISVSNDIIVSAREQGGINSVNGSVSLCRLFCRRNTVIQPSTSLYSVAATLDYRIRPESIVYFLVDFFVVFSLSGLEDSVSIKL